MNKKTLIIISATFVCLLIAGFAYWYFFFNGPGNGTPMNAPTSGQNPNGGFRPLNSGSAGQDQATGAGASGTSTPSSEEPQKVAGMPALRMLSGTPVGGYAASTSATTTVVRWIDRGKGDVYQARMDSDTISTLSNTLLPRIYNSVWNRDLNVFIGSILPDSSEAIPTTVYAALKAQADPAASSSDIIVKTPYDLRGNNLPNNVLAYAASPKGNNIFLLMDEGGDGVGYIAKFDGTKMTKLFDTPLTQVNVEWPETNILTITTKGSASQSGFLYFVSTKTGVWKKILGPIAGLSTRTSHDGKYVLASSASNDQYVDTAIYSVAGGSLTSAVVRTLADKCAWGNFYTDIVYCAVPSQPVPGTYPDDWYRGTLSTIDKIWQINAATEEIHLVTDIVGQSDRVIDAFNLGLDPKDNYLFFMNKNDLTLWSYDLVAGH